MSLGVICECDTFLRVTEQDFGRTITCSCGARVVVPLREEFRNRDELLSSSTVERRVHRLIRAGELPDTDACLKCGTTQTQEVKVKIECERYTTRTSGGQRFLFIPLPWGFLGSTWHEEERVEFRGRDVDVPAPVALCTACHRQLQAPAVWRYVLYAVLLLAVGGGAAYLAVLLAAPAAVAVVVVAAAGVLALLAVKRRDELRKWQVDLKYLIGKVPAYSQVLSKYWQAVVVVPPVIPCGSGDAGRDLVRHS
jgi:hypothetical protein